MTTDWTCGPDGLANTSEAYEEAVRVVEDLIRGDATKLIAGRADMTARLVVSHLAHKHGFGPDA